MWHSIKALTIVASMSISMAGCANILTIQGIDTEHGSITSEEGRNNWQNARMAETNSDCTALLNRLQEQPRKVSLGMRITSVVLAAWATTSPESITTELTAGAAAFTALDQTIAESYPDDIQTIISGIQYGQQIIRNQIRRKQKTDLTTYGIKEAVADVVRYNGACSVGRGRSFAAQAAAAGFSQLMRAQQQQAME